MQQVADDREGNCPADPDRHAKMPFIDLISQLHQSFNVHSLKAWHDDLHSVRLSVIGLSEQINGPEWPKTIGPYLRIFQKICGGLSAQPGWPGPIPIHIIVPVQKRPKT